MAHNVPGIRRLGGSQAPEGGEAYTALLGDIKIIFYYYIVFYSDYIIYWTCSATRLVASQVLHFSD